MKLSYLKSSNVLNLTKSNVSLTFDVTEAMETINRFYLNLLKAKPCYLHRLE